MEVVKIVVTDGVIVMERKEPKTVRARVSIPILKCTQWLYNGRPCFGLFF